MMVFKLHDFIRGAITRVVSKTDGKGGVINSRVTFEPDTEYEVSDPLLIDYMTGKMGDNRQKSVYSVDLLNELKARNIPYEISKCGTCSNSKPNLLYNPFMVVKEDTNEG